MKHILNHISKMPYSLKYAPQDKICNSLLIKKHHKILDWEHEPKTFWFEGIKRGCVSYKPDFRVIELNGSSIWYEVKGYYDTKSITKHKRFAKYFPEEK